MAATALLAAWAAAAAWNVAAARLLLASLEVDMNEPRCQQGRHTCSRHIRAEKAHGGRGGGGCEIDSTVLLLSAIQLVPCPSCTHTSLSMKRTRFQGRRNGVLPRLAPVLAHRLASNTPTGTEFSRGHDSLTFLAVPREQPVLVLCRLLFQVCRWPLTVELRQWLRRHGCDKLCMHAYQVNDCCSNSTPSNAQQVALCAIQHVDLAAPSGGQEHATE